MTIEELRNEQDAPIVIADPQGRIQWCNTAFDHLIGKPHIEVLGGQLVELLPLAQNGRPVAPEAHPLLQTLRSGSPLRDDYEFSGGGGRQVLEISAARAEVGQKELSAVLVVMNITVRRQAEEALKKEKEALAMMNKVMMNREDRILELKQEVNELLAALGKPPKYGPRADRE